MSAATERRAEILFYEAIERLRSERDDFLNDACHTDAALRAEVDELLRAHDGAAGFLPEDAPASPELETQFIRMKPETAGERIGPYKLLEQIGEGGFGVVWVAEQEAPVRRRVALKIIKLGMDTKEVIARFEQERQALAMMDHPNIAKVLDAGATSTGRPYFVMELVRGIKITKYCDQANLPTAERLKLFIAVCHAVQHAHQKGIIHRDLKPSNILVTLHDGVPVPKVIDFGIAKATQQQRLTDLTIYTQFEQMVGTPLYMSPEQAEMSGLDIDTRSDIYSLGVLLYELLAGRTPFDPETLMKRGLDEIRRAVRKQEPQRPSTFVSTMALDLRTNLAQHRQTDSAKLIGQIRGDLDWIVMKALEKDRARRYETANGLAQDIQRHLQSEPVLARPPTMGYRFRRMARRNKLAFTAGAGIAAALLAGLSVSTWMFFKEKKARDRAVAAEQLAVTQEKKATTEVSKSQQVAQFLKDMLKGVGPSVALGRDTVMLREILNNTDARVGKDLNDQPAVEADLRSTIGDVYFALGDWVKAGTRHSEALALRRQLFGDEHPDVASSLSSLAVSLARQGKKAEAEPMLRQALAVQRKLLKNEHEHLSDTIQYLADLLVSREKFAEAESLAREAVAIEKKRLGNDHLDVAESLGGLANVFMAQEKLSEAESLCHEILVMKRKQKGDNHPDVAILLSNLAVVLKRQGKLAEAETMNREALALSRTLLGPEHPDLATTLHNQAVVLRDKGEVNGAEAMFRDVLAMRRKSLSNEHPDVAESIEILATTLCDQGETAESETLAREALAMRRKLFGNGHEAVASSLHILAYVLSKQGKLVEAESLNREALEMRRKVLGNEHQDVAASLHSLAFDLMEQRKLAESETMFREAIGLWRKLADPNLIKSLHALGRVLQDQGNLTEAETFHREALAMKRKRLGNEHPDVDVSLHDLAYVLKMQRKLDEAESMYREALAMRKKRLGSERPEVAQSLNDLGHVLDEQNKPAQAETMIREAVAILRNVHGDEHPDVADCLNYLVGLQMAAGKRPETEALAREALALNWCVRGDEHPQVAIALNHLARLASKPDEAEALAREAVEMNRRLLGYEHREVAVSLFNLAFILSAQGRLDESQARNREALAMLRNLNGNGDEETAFALFELAVVLRNQRKLVEAEITFREAADVFKKVGGDKHPMVLESLEGLAGVLHGQGKVAEEELIRREVVEIVRKLALAESMGAWGPLAEFLHRQGRFAEAEALYREAFENHQTLMGTHHKDTLAWKASHARVLADWAWSERCSPSDIKNTSPEIAERARQSEHHLRDCLAIRLQGPEAMHWRTTGDVPSRLGGALVAVAATDPDLTREARLAKHTEAETLLLKGNEVLQNGEKVDNKYKRDSLTRLVRLYEAWKKRDKAVEWQKKLDDFNKAETEPAVVEKEDSLRQ